MCILCEIKNDFSGGEQRHQWIKLQRILGDRLQSCIPSPRDRMDRLREYYNRPLDELYHQRLHGKNDLLVGFEIIRQELLQEQSPGKFRLQRVSGDGNCFFRAISYVRYGTEDHHRVIRDMAITHMIQHADEYNDFIEYEDHTDFEKYIRHMKKQRVWCDGVIIRAVSMILSAHIWIHHASNPIVKYTQEKNPIHPTIHVQYTGAHYDALINI